MIGVQQEVKLKDVAEAENRKNFSADEGTTGDGTPPLAGELQ